MSRYHRKNIISKEAGVSTYEGLDPLTGLAVYIYEFETSVSPYLEKLESENISGILDIYTEGNKTQVVTALSKGYHALKTPLRIDRNMLLLDSARALRDAARLNIVHGDIKPERFLATNKHLVIEGFGIPWQVKSSSYRPSGEDSSLAADVYAWGRSILELTNGNLNPAMTQLVNSCVSAQASSRPSAKRIYKALLEIIEKSKKPTLDTLELSPASSEQNLAEETNFGDTAGYLPITDSTQAKPLADIKEKPSPIPNDKPAPMPLKNKPRPDANKEVFSEPIRRVDNRSNRPTSQDKQSGFVRDLPPGTTYKKGDSFNKSKSRRNILDEFDEIDKNSNTPKTRNRTRLLALVAIFLAAASLGAFALFRQGSFIDSPAPIVQHYVVDVEILPNNLPPVDVVVVSSPAGSSLLPGTILQRVSGRESIALDKEGLWELQGRFQSSSSDVVQFQLPEDRHVVITIKPSTP
ncbi:MAG TPA: protein kinase family protein [Trueperaceae bacterium]|nr:protein kinase family protein [Trueperaceae bacterium]